MTSDRPHGGRRPEEFPEARARDLKILEMLRAEPGGLTRNQLALGLGLADQPRLVTYALTRLRAARRVGHVREGCEGHGYWCLTLIERMNGS